MGLISKLPEQNVGMKKRVLFIVTVSEWGGAQQFLFKLIRGLSGKNLEFLVAVGNDGDGTFYNKLAGMINVVTLKQLKRNISPVSDIRALWEIKNLIEHWEPDTVFLNSSIAGFIGSAAVRFLVKSPKPRVIYRIGGWVFNDPKPKWERWLYILLEKISSRWKDVIVVNNLPDYRQADKYGIKPREKLELVYNGIDPYTLDLLPKEEARGLILDRIAKKTPAAYNPAYIVGTIANFYKTKGLEYLVRSAKLLLDKIRERDTGLKILYVIIGDGEERMNLEKTIKELNLKDNVFLFGRVENAHRYLPAFDVFVLPSLKEGHPWALIEAMAAKIPAVVTSVGANIDIIENGKNGLLVPPGNSEALAEAVELMLLNEHLRLKVAIGAHQTIVLNFDLNKMVSRIESLL
ncbi:MAG: glycosyl transferase family protein [Parcubacteria group bacterium Licking1014_17]|nr:MAG: glycosyl transferase family protein [Parcubacteria group bacterium Licking1014_17]